MTTEEELALSYYREIGMLNAEHGVALVQHIQTKRLYVRKTLNVYNAEVYRYLMSHPIENTPRIYEAVEDKGVLTVIEEYIDGSSLSELLKSGPIREEKTIQIIRKLCGIVEDLHSCSPAIVHRDIKPSNILLTDDGTVKLLDMNAAKQYRSQNDHDTQLIGTAGFAAPEQYGFGSSSTKTDIYAIGVLMATMKYGAFYRSTLNSTEFDRIVEICTRLDPEARYPSVGALISDLDSLLNAAQPKGKKQKQYYPWLPPGFRSLNPLRMLFSFFLYALIFLMGLNMTVTNPISQADVVLNKVFFILCCLSSTFFLGNYMNVWEALRITKVKTAWLRWLLILCGASLVFTAGVFIMVIIETAIR